MWRALEWKKWRLVLKLDPDKELPEAAFKILQEPNVDAVFVGGTQGITYENTVRLISLVRQSGYNGPLIQEISTEDSVVPDVNAHFIPVVLNSDNRYWIIDAHLSAIKKYRKMIPWERTVTEGYLVCNRDSAVGRHTNARIVSIEDAVAYTILAEEVFKIPLLYIEYSGNFGDMDLVRAVSAARNSIHLVYGGGIKTADQLNTAASLVNTVVIGNIIYDNPVQAAMLVRNSTLTPNF
ncbi:MAG: heptaprenylglyceryl phosphate synthase [Bacillota bacterium]